MMVALLLAACTVGVVVLSYFAVRQSVTKAAQAHLENAAAKVAPLLAPRPRLGAGDRIAASSRIRDWLISNGDATTVQFYLDSLRGINNSMPALAVRRARDGAQVVSGDSSTLRLSAIRPHEFV